MFGIKKRKIQVWSVIFSSAVILLSCNENSETAINYTDVRINGETQGTTYSIIIAAPEVGFTKEDIDSVLLDFDNALSTYVPTSVISHINNAHTDTIVVDKSGYFKQCYEQSLDVFDATGGAFDPSVFPLVSGWGFMKNMKSPLSQRAVDSILNYVGMDKDLHRVLFSGDTIYFDKRSANFKLDFNAIAQGQSVDVLANYIKEQGYSNFYIEIGGEVFVSGLKQNGEEWKIGIDTPIENAENRVIESNIVSLSNKAIATSGNYRKFYEIDGKKYAHTLNPKTGFPVKHNLLSATVVAKDCATADAYATAFMVMGKDKTLEFVQNSAVKLDVYLIYADESGGLQRVTSKGFEVYIE